MQAQSGFEVQSFRFQIDATLGAKPQTVAPMQRKWVFTTGSFLVTQFNASRKPVIVIGLRRSVRLVSPIRQAVSQNAFTRLGLVGIGNPASSTAT